MSYAAAARIVRQAVKNKSYRAYPMGQEWGDFMRRRRGSFTESTYRDYESCGDKLARWSFERGLEMEDFETPKGTPLLEEFLDELWGEAAPRTYNKNLSIVGSFFKDAALRGKLHGNPSLPIQRHKKRDVHREVFNSVDRARILADGPDPEHVRRDRICLRLLLYWGLRKGALRSIQFKHFDSNRQTLTIFTKGGKVQTLPLADPKLWDDLAKLSFEIEAAPDHYLLPRHKTVMVFMGYDRQTGAVKNKRVERFYPPEQIGEHGCHNWWYRCLGRAGITAKGQTSGERMHKARHSSGQLLLDRGANPKAIQKLLGHADISTTLQIYADWDDAQLAQSMRASMEVDGE